MFHTYVLYSEAFNKIYIGHTSKLEARILSHNVLGTKGWTIRFRPWKLVYSEQFSSKKEAMAREKQLKSAQGRKFIRSLPAF
ncbi:MAG TPA: GIY-YIG nuclease family protein [Cyclobacteriaceae bacterium]|nr:GIY-YIG nuclease family protein [Cyclobacteriaceae bacterium]MCB0498919.1 GIY-YIG nuclease family protein [Cyclobacteriaceae bacterium]MCB9237567.1 GIY-YIG nuclease family protein [Flammeovirgaceae bacterium]MCW5902307.1 GIY-YIG nuclease family protein [Cyclobacteriaceae bacterium]HOO10877.1 GIY-YIG nuclease family protein [Cyclobacteriaceae bacterium]